MVVRREERGLPVVQTLARDRGFGTFCVFLVFANFIDACTKAARSRRRPRPNTLRVARPVCEAYRGGYGGVRDVRGA